MYHSSVRGGKITYPEKFSSSVLRLDFSPFVGKFNFWMAKVISESENFEKEYHE